MASHDIRPKWWQLYLTAPLLIVLFILDNRLKLSPRGHQVLQIGIILLVYGLIYLWLKTNSRAISRMDQEQYYGRITVIQIPASQLPDLDEEKRPSWDLPDSEIRGVLSDTYEMDYINLDSLPIDEISKELDKD